MVNPTETFVTGESVEVCILVIPHRWLGGVSLVVRSFQLGMDLLWAAVIDLSDHDQIDLGFVVRHWPSSQGMYLRELIARLAEELSRQVGWKQTYLGASGIPSRITALIDHDGRRLKLDVRHHVSVWPFTRREVVEQTALDAAQPPAFRLPVPIEKLLAQA
jgi:hypothetical protein